MAGELIGGRLNPAPSGRRNCDEQQRIGKIQSNVILPKTNIERFLCATTPSVPAHYTPEAYFMLDDLWESFKEWSAFGAGVPLLMNELDYVLQFYVPYLSAIQIFVEPSKAHADLRQVSQENQGIRSVEDSINICPRMENFCLKDQQTAVKEGLSSGNVGSVKPQGHLAFQYLEHDIPFRRKPLYSKINELALCAHELKNLRSCDVLPSSWFSVAWYPIYKLPTGPAKKGLDACFLTFHSLCTPPGLDPGGLQADIRLPSFGLSFYKYREYVWASGSRDGPKLVKALSEAACVWLKGLQVQLPDYNFFMSRR